ncbi:MAG TPA: hypothetical protein VD905_05660 [Flavobacteriales bacterium]|nr:hypothetical protein [Flavobacteriales bacterium]
MKSSKLRTIPDAVKLSKREKTKKCSQFGRRFLNGSNADNADFHDNRYLKL